MHLEFSDWYRAAGMEPPAELPKRWAAIEAYTPDSHGIVALARLFYGLGKPDEAVVTAFQTVLQNADSSFQISNNDRELSVLAGAELVDLLQREDSGHADLAALSLVCAAGANLRPAPPVKAIPEHAARYLNGRTLSRSAITDNDEIEVDDELLTALAAGAAPHPELAKRLRRMQRQIDLVREESNMLWWLFAEHSRDEQKRWSKIPFPAVPLMAAKELSDLTYVIPGPVATRAFLDRVIQGAKSKPPTSLSITDAINNLSVEWRGGYTNEGCPVEIESLLPITLGMKLSLTAPDNDEWFPALTRGTQLSSTSKIAPDALAHQTFLEAMLCRAWRQLTK
jgi:hypothetical protein